MAATNQTHTPVLHCSPASVRLAQAHPSNFLHLFTMKTVVFKFAPRKHFCVNTTSQELHGTLYAWGMVYKVPCSSVICPTLVKLDGHCNSE